MTLHSASPAHTRRAARKLAPCLSPPFRVYLSGGLAAGKTLWTRALLRRLGERGKVPSPSYTTAYTYVVGDGRRVHHLDLFRHSPGTPLDEEFYELLDDEALCIVEWPERASDMPPPDVAVHFAIGDGDCRRLQFAAADEKGWECLRVLSS